VYYPEEVSRLEREGKYWYRPPGGESRPDVALRVHSFLDTLVRDYSGHKVVIVCHSVVVLTFRRLFERWGEEKYLQVDAENDVRNCAITEYAPDDAGKIRLKYYNVYPARVESQGIWSRACLALTATVMEMSS
jgi:probable phosphoglycerate mutase